MSFRSKKTYGSLSADASHSQSNTSTESATPNVTPGVEEEPLKPSCAPVSKESSNPVILTQKKLPITTSALPKSSSTPFVTSSARVSPTASNSTLLKDSTTANVPSVQKVPMQTSTPSQGSVQTSSTPSTKPLTQSKTVFGPFSPPITNTAATQACRTNPLLGTKEIPKPFRTFQPPVSKFSSLRPITPQASTLIHEPRVPSADAAQHSAIFLKQSPQLRPQFKPGQQPHVKAPIVGASKASKLDPTAMSLELKASILKQSQPEARSVDTTMANKAADTSSPTLRTPNAEKSSEAPLHMSEPTPNAANTEPEPSSLVFKRKQPDQGVENFTRLKKSRSGNSRRTAVPNWPDNVTFNEKEEVITIDAEGKEQVVCGSVLPRDVWNNTGVRYVVQFNKFNQPIRKGGDILVKFLGDIAKKERFCPVGVKNWHGIHKTNKAEIIKLVRGHFVIPEDEVLNKGVLHRVDKSWRQYRYSLRSAHFKQNDKTIEQIYDNVPDGITRDNWMRLVDYWNSPEGQKLSKLGKDARASQAHKHTSGATSFANRRADFEEENDREPTELEFFKLTRSKKDGKFMEGTLSEKFLDLANSKVEETLASSSSKSQFDIENEVFDELMYEGEIPKRPINYGFGVKQSDVFGVQGILRKEGYTRSNNNAMDVENLKHAYSTMKKENEELRKQNQDLANKFDENTQVFKTIVAQMDEVLNVVRCGKASNELLQGAQLALRAVASQVPDASSGYLSSRSGSNPSTSDKPT